MARGVDMRCFSEAKQEHRILDETRRSIIDALLALGNLTGDKEYHEFAKLVCPSLDEGTISEIARHMDRFDDWPESYLLDTVIDYLHLPDEDFCFLLEQYVNPNIHHSRWIAEEERRGQIHNSELVKVINRYLSHDEYQLEIKDSIGDKDFYQCVSSRAGVQGTVKNIIFAARYKPEIVFDDALNNDIRITKNADKCLIYDRAIPQNGLLWSELVEWFSAKTGSADNVENHLLRRLCDSLDDSFKATGAKSGPETWLMQAYYELMKSFGMDFPALLPQVYLYYDPLTQTQRGYKLFEHQKMDFLMVFSHRNRVVIEIDGKQHYAEGDIASPRLYSEMVKAQRELSLYGYDVYRFGGYEFANAAESDRVKQELLKKLKEFFVRLFQKYNVLER